MSLLNQILSTVTGAANELRAGVSGYVAAGGVRPGGVSAPAVIPTVPAGAKPAVDYTPIIVVGFLLVLVIVVVARMSR